MKRLLILPIVITCAFCITYGQDLDLIVTTTGDSLICKIEEVNAGDIQFRFSGGNIISIKRSETASYQYNFVTATPERAQPFAPLHSRKRQRREKFRFREYPPFYAALSAGSSTFGNVSCGDPKGFVLSLGADAAYFFNNNTGAGLKFNINSCDVVFNELITYSDRLMFYGAALYGRWRKNKVTFSGSAAVGGLYWTFSKAKSPPASELPFVLLVDDNISQKSVGGFFSAGIGYSLTNSLGVGLNVQSLTGAVKSAGQYKISRNPTGVSCSFGINFSF